MFFFVLTDGKIFSPTNLKSLTNQVLITALVGVGAVFVFGAGAFDMSMSGSVALAAIIGRQGCDGNRLHCLYADRLSGGLPDAWH